ncbi:FBD domain-containing protein [Heracleum sosnowskyi]|uniref:FBD domain-containing protein n=1 Tax=Heracleum sosnowskyi TaxID=360622 RepID=A0AAD8MG61_9APIA|nr:FBD domain-containing protein [Heracleum sosnowskyi]
MAKKLKISEKDRVSDLPDSLLLKILSLLPTKDAACTSILSKRWRPLSMSLPNLDLCDENYNDSGVKFANFVDRILMHRPDDLKIENFGLVCGNDNYLDRVDEWIRNAIQRDLKVIDLCFWFTELFEMLDEVFLCTSVEKLRMSSKILVDVPEDVKFTRLRVLKFDEVTFSSYESVSALLLNCPVLEDLTILCCEWLSGDRLSICGSALKKLSIYGNSIDEEFLLEILIDTPVLETLQLGTFASDDILIKENLPFLTRAHIDVEQIIEGVTPSTVFGDCVFGLLKKINHVKSLSLSDRTVEALNRAYTYDFRTVHDSFPPFHNLIDLELSVEVYCGETLLYDFLDNSPNLQSLVFPQGLVDTLSDENWRFTWAWEHLHIPECLSAHLKTVDIREFSGTDDELSFVEYLLVYGSALKNVSINLLNLRGGEEVRQALLNYQRESTTCELNLFF